MSFLGDMSRDRKKWACTVQTLWTQTMKHKTNGVSTIEFSKSGKKLSQLLHTTCCTCCFLIWKRRSIPKIPRQTLQSRFFCWFTMMWTLWHTAKHLEIFGSPWSLWRKSWRRVWCNFIQVTWRCTLLFPSVRCWKGSLYSHFRQNFTQAMLTGIPYVPPIESILKQDFMINWSKTPAHFRQSFPGSYNPFQTSLSNCMTTLEVQTRLSKFMTTPKQPVSGKSHSVSATDHDNPLFFHPPRHIHRRWQPLESPASFYNFLLPSFSTQPTRDLTRSFGSMPGNWTALVGCLEKKKISWNMSACSDC
jgi:hypothetical protein